MDVSISGCSCDAAITDSEQTDEPETSEIGEQEPEDAGQAPDDTEESGSFWDRFWDFINYLLSDGKQS